MTQASPSWSQTFPVVGPSTSEPFLIGITCSNMPTDGEVGFTVAQPAPMPPIDVPLQPIVNPNMTISVRTQWPPNGQGSITIDYLQGPTPPPPGASITPVVLVLASGAEFEPMAFESCSEDIL